MKKVFIVMLLILAAVPAVFAGDLEDVRDTGVLRVGVSADGAPFAFYGEDEELTGIDIRLIEAIAEKMGVRAEIYEMSGESLPDALAVGQIDAAGGAFSKTAEREKSLDFTSVYYTTGAVFVSRSGLGLTEPLSAASFSGLKIGTRKGSCFEEWLREELTEKGDVPARDIYTYTDIADAVKALNRGRIDLVMMDANIYMARYQSDPDLRSRQYGSAEDNYAFAVRKGSNLRAELSKHLLAMLRDGTAQKIADSFFTAQQEEDEMLLQWPTAGVPEQLPTALPPTAAPTSVPTAVPTVTPTSAPDKCTSYAMAYVADLTIPDGTYLSAGQYFTKTWRIKNTGSCGWTTDFSFVFASGDQMGGKNIRLPKNVAPGETVDLSVDMYAPTTPGNYQGNWQLKTGSNYAVGPAIWLKITVPGPSYTAPTVPPYSYYYPTADPGPVQQAVKAQIFWFYPNFYAQKKGECVNVYWGLGSFSTAELFVDGTAVYYGGDERVMQQLCGEVSAVGDHEIRLCAYSTGGTTCDSFTYTTEP